MMPSPPPPREAPRDHYEPHNVQAPRPLVTRGEMRRLRIHCWAVVAGYGTMFTAGLAADELLARMGVHHLAHIIGH